MSQDIRSFFTVLSKKTNGNNPAKPVANKRKAKRLIDSDDDDVICETPPEKSKQKKTKIVVISSDSEDEKPQTSKSAKKEPKLKAARIEDVFSKAPVKQSKVTPVKVVEKVSQPRKKSEKKVHDDKAFEKTLDDLDDDFESNLEELDKTIDELEKKEETMKKRARSAERNDTPTKRKKIEHTDSGIDPGQEAHEKRRYSAMLYQKYLNRSGPKHHGSKELPKGKPDCLKGLCFLRTGVLDSLDSDEFDDLIKTHGGRTVHAVSKKVNYVVAGDEPGPAKLAKAESYNIPTISEDELLDLILTKSGMKPKYSQKNVSSSSSEDLGIEADCDKNKEKKTEKKTNESEEKNKKELPEQTKANIDTMKKKSEENKKTEKKTKEELIIIKENKVEKKEKIESKTENVTMSLTEKYKPQSLKAVIGQQGDKSNLHKLKHWLENWYKNHCDPKRKKALVKPSPWSQHNDDGAYFKCALLSGPPGVGKTTTATLVAKELQLDVVEFNASDTRSKKLLHEEVAQLLHTRSIAGFATGKSNLTNKRVLLMDEVDGMAGNEDRGGIQELIQLIKTTNVPIICMCNDRNHQKMRSLVNYCFDLRFSKPKVEQIRGAMLSICFKEHIDVSPQALTEIITGTGCDIRQTLNHLAVLGTTKNKITNEVAQKEAKASKKDTIMGPWEVCRTVFCKNDHKDMTVSEKAKLFFYDYSLGPLFVQENYTQVQPDGANPKQSLLRAAQAAASISTGEVISSKIRKTNNWSLLESQAFYSSVFPGHFMSGQFMGQINFPRWLGKNSKRNKFARMQSEIQGHTRLSASASKLAIKLDYLGPLLNAVTLPLRTKGMEGIDEAVNVMNSYSLLREDLDGLMELCSWSGKNNAMGGIETKVKTAFTKLYNKKVVLPFALASVAKKRTVALGEDEEEEEEEPESDDDISKNAMIKVKKKPAKVSKSDEAGTSKKAKGKGKKK